MRWRPIVGYERWYEVSDLGEVRRVAPGRHTFSGFMLHPTRLTGGYLQVKLSVGSTFKRYSVHRLVAEAFLGPCPAGKQVNHKDGDKTNNVLGNLEYVTAKENQQHSLRLGLRGHGEAIKNAKLTELDVRAMRALRWCGWSQRKLAAAFGVSPGTVWPILQRKQWRHV